MAANMESGDIDAVDFFYDQNYIDEFNTNDDIVLYKIASQTQYILYMNMQKAPFDNVRSEKHFVMLLIEMNALMFY